MASAVTWRSRSQDPEPAAFAAYCGFIIDASAAYRRRKERTGRTTAA